MLLGIWELYVKVSGVNSLILPAPSDVLRALIDDRGTLWHNLKTTAVEIVCGIAIAAVAGLLVAVLLHFSDVVRGARCTRGWSRRRRFRS